MAAGARPPSAHLLAALALYLGYALFLTWPAVTDPGSILYGQDDVFRSGDLAGSIANLRQLIDDGQHPFAAGRLTQIAAPAGLEIPWQSNLASLPSTLILWLLGLLFGATASYFLFTLLGYVLSGAAMFLLTRRFTESTWIALIAGWAFAFFPFAVLGGTQHPQFVHSWVFVLLAWRMLVLSERPTVRNGVLLGAATALTFFWTPYFVLLGAVLYAVLALCSVGFAARGGRMRAQLPAHAVGAAISLAALIAVALLATHGTTGTATRANNISQLVQYSARALEYVVPPSSNLLAGDRTGPFLERRLHGSNPEEATLYVGISILLLAAAAAIAALRRRLAPEQTAIVVSALLLTAVALVLSAPPNATVLGHYVSMPSRLIFEIAPGYRVLSRFVILVMLGLCVLAAIGLAALVRGSSPRRRTVVLLAVSVLVAVDVAGHRPTTDSDLRTPATYARLASLAPGVVAEYPVLQATDDGVQTELFFQPEHRKRVLGGYAEKSPSEEWALAVRDLDAPDTPGKLAVLGVRYVVVPPGAPVRGMPRRGLRLLGQNRDGKLLEVTAQPGAAFRLEGAESLTVSDPRFRWLTGSRAAIHLQAGCRRCAGSVVFKAASLWQPRTVNITGPGLSRSLRIEVPTGSESEFRVPLRFSRRTVLRLAIEPGPQSTAGTGTPDVRDVSIYLASLRFEADAGQPKLRAAPER